MDILTTDELLQLPPPRWLIDGVVPEGDYSVLWGPSQQGKSFIALDWAVCISEGLSWHDRPTIRGPVVYIAAEGGRGIAKRIRALMTHYQLVDLPGLYYIVKPVMLREATETDILLNRLEQLDVEPALIIVDTLSRTFGGGDENGADMGQFVDRVAYLASEHQTTVLVIHHSNAGGKRERGNTALRCGANAMFECRAVMEGSNLQKVCVIPDKQKDDMRGEEYWLQVQAVEDSIVLVPGAPPPATPRARPGHGTAQPMSADDMYRVLTHSEEGYTWGEWKLATGLEKSAFCRRLARLKNADDARVYFEAGRYHAITNIDPEGNE